MTLTVVRDIFAISFWRQFLFLETNIFDEFKHFDNDGFPQQNVQPWIKDDVNTSQADAHQICCVVDAACHLVDEYMYLK